MVPRYSLCVDLELTDVQSGIQIKRQTKDLSLFGCGVETTQPFPKGTNVKIKISHLGAIVEAFARVVYANPELGMGIVFTTLGPEDERTLVGWIADLMAEERSSE